jgi:hypothetical protein
MERRRGEGEDVGVTREHGEIPRTGAITHVFGAEGVPVAVHRRLSVGRKDDR